MKQNKYSQMIFSEDDVCDLLMQGRTMDSLQNMIVDDSVDLERAAMLLEYVPPFVQDYWNNEETVEEFHRRAQSNWHMPEEYKNLDIAAYVLNLCQTQEELQRCGEELLMYQERNLFDLLRYLKYLVDVMKQHRLIWGVGRGSSVASYVLYKLEIHRVNSMFYDLDPGEFLR